jgi:hypothetical protein
MWRGTTARWCWLAMSTRPPAARNVGGTRLVESLGNHLFHRDQRADLPARGTASLPAGWSPDRYPGDIRPGSAARASSEGTHRSLGKIVRSRHADSLNDAFGGRRDRGTIAAVLSSAPITNVRVREAEPGSGIPCWATTPSRPMLCPCSRSMAAATAAAHSLGRETRDERCRGRRIRRRPP